MHEVPTDKLALQVWWAMVWRAMPLALLAGIAVGFLAGIAGSFMNISVESVQGPLTFLGFVLGLFITVKVIKHLMTKGFGVYRLAVVRK